MSRIGIDGRIESLPSKQDEASRDRGRNERSQSANRARAGNAGKSDSSATAATCGSARTEAANTCSMCSEGTDGGAFRLVQLDSRRDTRNFCV